MSNKRKNFLPILECNEENADDLVERARADEEALMRAELASVQESAVNTSDIRKDVAAAAAAKKAKRATSEGIGIVELPKRFSNCKLRLVYINGYVMTVVLNRAVALSEFCTIDFDHADGMVLRQKSDSMALSVRIGAEAFALFSVEEDQPSLTFNHNQIRQLQALATRNSVFELLQLRTNDRVYVRIVDTDVDTFYAINEFNCDSSIAFNLEPESYNHKYEVVVAGEHVKNLVTRSEKVGATVVEMKVENDMLSWQASSDGAASQSIEILTKCIRVSDLESSVPHVDVEFYLRLVMVISRFADMSDQCVLRFGTLNAERAPPLYMKFTINQHIDVRTVVGAKNT